MIVLPSVSFTVTLNAVAVNAVPAVALGNGVTAKLLAGTLNGVKGPVDTGATEPFYADLAFAEDGGRAVIPLTAGHNAFVYVFEGAVSVGSGALPRVSATRGRRPRCS